MFSGGRFCVLEEGYKNTGCKIFPKSPSRHDPSMVQAVAEDCFSQALASDDVAAEADGSDSGFPEASSSSTSPIPLKKKASAAAGKPARPQPAKTPKQGNKTERVGERSSSRDRTATALLKMPNFKIPNKSKAPRKKTAKPAASSKTKTLRVAKAKSPKAKNPKANQPASKKPAVKQAKKAAA